MQMKIWDPQHETMPREDLEQLQLERLQATLNRAYKNVTCYRTKFNSQGIIPEDVSSLAALSKLPFTPTTVGLPVVPDEEWIRTTSRSGTANMP